ncbi:MAG: uroporphyrinogen decarboxylase family protein [Deferrisomatales bacterium]|nr:uroporphyrinogen decarboxylase family protein [Deferrisomatales bacterium]
MPAAMSSLERVATAVQLKEPDRVPVIPVLMIRALRAAGLQATRETLHDPETMAEAKLEAFRRFGGDALVAGTGLNVEAEALGCEMEYQEEEIPVVVRRPLEDAPAFDRIAELGLDKGRVRAVAEEVEILNREWGTRAVVGVCCSGPFSTAMELRGLAAGVQDMAADPAYAGRLLDWVTDQIIRYVDLLIDHGALAINMLDPLCSSDVISPQTYRDWVLPRHRRVMEHVRSRQRVPIVHVCTHTGPIWADLAATGALAFHGDIRPSLEACKREIGGRLCLIGNVDPVEVLLYGDPGQVTEAAQACIRAAGPGGGFVLAAGCDTGYDVPDENLHALVEAARRSTYPLT